MGVKRLKKVILLKNENPESKDVELQETVLPVLLDFKETMNYLKVSNSTLRTMVRKNEIPHCRIRGKIVFYASDIKSYLESNKKGA